ncbi:MAG: exopolysaccharide biosynthesis protein [Pseudomonadota bacterium]
MDERVTRESTFLRQLAALAEDPQRERVSVSDIFGAGGAQGAIVAPVLVFALPNVIPAPPGTSTVLGLPLLLLTLEWTLGRAAWLPRFIARRSLARHDFATLLARATPWITRTRGWLSPRLGLFVSPPAVHLAAALCAVLALLIMLPIPLGNMLPAWAISLIAVGVIGRDGAWVLAGTATGVASIAVVWGVVMALVQAALAAVQQWLG